MVHSIEFYISNFNKLSELLLYSRLRLYASSHGGFFQDYDFSHNEKYKLLPKLVKLGWVTNEYRIIKHRFVAAKYTKTSIWNFIPQSALENKHTLGGYIVSICEAYLLQRQYRMQKGFNVISIRDNKPVRKRLSKEQRYKIYRVKNLDYGLRGTIHSDRIAELLGVTKRTLSVYRRYSGNSYESFNTIAKFGEDPHFISKVGAPIIKVQKITTVLRPKYNKHIFGHFKASKSYKSILWKRSSNIDAYASI